MARQRISCTSCGAKIPVEAFCPNCGIPTPHCSAQERIVWEMGQWESSRSSGRPKSPPSTSVLPVQTAPAPERRSVERPAALSRPDAPVRRTFVAPAASMQPAAQVRSSAPHSVAPVQTIAAGSTSVAGSAALAELVEPVELQRRRSQASSRPTSPSSRLVRTLVKPAATATVPMTREDAAIEAEEVARQAAAPAAPVTQSTNAAMSSGVIRTRRRSEPEPVAHVEPTPNARETRRAERAARKEAEATERAACKQAEEASKEAAKAAAAATKAAARAKPAATVKAAAPVKAEAPAKAPKQTNRSRRERRLEQIERVLNLRDDETITLTVRGRAGTSRATLVLTRFRIAVVARRNKVRWIPLEEISDVTTAWRGAPTIQVNATIETLRFSQRSSSTMSEVVEQLENEVREARAPGARRHEASITQEWCDLTGEVWDSSTGRFRLWIRRHPVFTLSWLGSVVPVAYLAAHHAAR